MTNQDLFLDSSICIAPFVTGVEHSFRNGDVFYGSVMSEFLRIARSTMLYKDFLPVAAKLFNRMKNQGGSTSQILKQIKKGMTRHPASFDFSKTSAQMVEDIQNGTRDG